MKKISHLKSSFIAALILTALVLFSLLIITDGGSFKAYYYFIIIVFFIVSFFLILILFNITISAGRNKRQLNSYSNNLPDQKKNINLSENHILFNKNDQDGLSKSKAEEINILKANEKYRKEFLGNISHELKTPIFNIQGYILTLLEGGLEDPSINMKYLRRTEKSINRMISIVKDLEAISKIEAGGLQLKFEDFNIIKLIEDVFEQEEIKAQKKNIKLKFARSFDVPVRVNAEKKGIFEILDNLIINGIYYGKENGSVVIDITKGKKVLVEVRDDGIGISKKHLSRIFERFYRVDKSRSRDEGGTGLGLAIVKHLIEAHDQEINISSSPGKGTSFTFSLNKSNK